MPRPSIIVSTYPRTISETFDRGTWVRLGEHAEIVSGRDETMPDAASETALASVTAVALGESLFGVDALTAAGPEATPELIESLQGPA